MLESCPYHEARFEAKAQVSRAFTVSPSAASLVPRPFLSLKKKNREKIARKGLGKWPTPQRSIGLECNRER